MDDAKFMNFDSADGLNGLARDAADTAKRREAKGQLKCDTMSILKHCAGEVCEAVEALLNCRWEESGAHGAAFADELADIITCALIAARNEGVDIDAALARVQEKNRRRAE